MKQASTLVILGAGGHGKVVADAALARGAWPRVVATDRNPARCRGELLPGVILLPLDAALALPDADFHVAIGSAEARERETELLSGRALASIVHPGATVSPHAVIEAGCFVAAQAVVAPSAVLGRGAIVNHGAVVDHDAQVGAFTHVAPHAALGGEVHVGRGVLVGAGAKVLPGLRICDGVTLGAGAVVLATIGEPGVYAGVPARRVR
ncbi:MAG: sugar O-acyltransferase, sialic acid O-acetyltransferase NeuD family [Ramlibacter sp.]|nr:sugar O-acyltransferase, sialic acid O-acetyltransferase NeuD family [Ramlibacter sp.]